MAALANDPARFKSAFTGPGGVNSGYAARVSAFNKALYQPSDTRVRPAQMPVIAPLSLSPGSRGWQQPAGRAGLMAIASKYRGTPTGAPEGLPPLYPGESPLQFRTVSNNPDVQPLNPNIPTLAGGAEPAGSAGPVGATGRESPALTGAAPTDNPNLGADMPEVVWDSNTTANGADIGALPNAAGANISTTDRYYARQAAHGVSRKSPDYQAARRFLRIDGSAPQSSRDTRPAPVDFTQPRNGAPSRSLGFGSDPQDTSADIRSKFKSDDETTWGNNPMGYGDLRKRYQFQEPS